MKAHQPEETKTSSRFFTNAPMVELSAVDTVGRTVSVRTSPLGMTNDDRPNWTTGPADRCERTLPFSSTRSTAEMEDTAYVPRNVTLMERTSTGPAGARRGIGARVAVVQVP